ncbi:hypothetical protein QTO34_012128 [Cnephaeus nilssonii]|uniref:Uncharacterized protein n=1 Tax=Cnephaeus nilssonii TaxID=3371016 RepID=A0AA40HC46_CNENI|nr:hypothetical protein QTO34_012128 [Eptesicus nilssonii]
MARALCAPGARGLRAGGRLPGRHPCCAHHVAAAAAAAPPLGIGDFQGCGRRLHPGGVGPAGLASEGPVPGRDAGELPEPSGPG